jgi:UDP-GlcNAc:undecaprenyl-phosphate/decaprenyl-phosphate GlcNAc-1-phosphate transferase
MQPLPLYFYVMVMGGGVLFSLAFTPVVKRFATAKGYIAVPKDNRWHRKQTALLGGISIFAALLLAWILGAAVAGWSLYGLSCLPIVVSAAAIFAIGLVDDLVDMAPQHKLAGQMIVTSCLMFFGLRLGWTDSDAINLFLTVFWIVGITNAFNLLDNMDGLAAGIAFIAGSFLFLHHFLNAAPIVPTGPLLLMLSAYLGAILGFLVYNMNPASIFMGDAGSLSIGFLLASFTVLGSPPQVRDAGFLNLLSVMAIPILIFFIPILDTGFVSLMRKLFKRRISQGGRDHSSHRLVAIGFSERKAVFVLYAFSALSGLIALSLPRLRPGVGVVSVLLYLLFVMFFWIYLAKVKVYEEDSILSGQTSRLLTPILVEITYKRRLLEVFLDFMLISIAYYLAYLLRFEWEPGENFPRFMKTLPVVIACQIFCFYVFGVYRGVWERTGLSDLLAYIKAISAGTVCSILFILFLDRFQGYSRTVFVIYWVFLLVFISLSRLSFRLLDEGIKKRHQVGRTTLIYGAGRGGQMAVEEIENNSTLGLALLGFIDDNPMIQGRKIKGYNVFGGLQEMERVIRKYRVQEVIISFKGRCTDRKRDVQNLCKRIGGDIEVKQIEVKIK